MNRCLTCGQRPDSSAMALSPLRFALPSYVERKLCVVCGMPLGTEGANEPSSLGPLDIPKLPLKKLGARRLRRLRNRR